MTLNDKETESQSTWENRKTFEMTKGVLEGVLCLDVPLDAN